MLEDVQSSAIFNTSIEIPALAMADWNCPQDCMPLQPVPSASIRVSISDMSPGLPAEEAVVGAKVQKLETHIGWGFNQQARVVDKQSLRNGSLSLRYFVLSTLDPGESLESGQAAGGEVVLHELVSVLLAHGHEARVLYLDDVEATDPEDLTAPYGVVCGSKQDMEYAVIIYPEIIPFFCKDSLAHVRWILAPMGVKAKKSTTARWLKDDLVFHYNAFGGTFQTVGKVAAIPVPFSNALQVLRDPQEDDGFDITKYPPLPRNGTVYTIRKGAEFHGNSPGLLHEPGDTCLDDLVGTRESSVLHAFRTHEYFISYDPMTFLSQIAAMLGCISVVAPVQDKSSALFWSKTALGPYMAERNLGSFPGVAYGLDQVEFARATMHQTRETLMEYKHWCRTVTVERMVRDVEAYVAGARSGFEGAQMVVDFFPDGWWNDE